MAFYHEIISGIWTILRAPFADLSTLWILAPLFLMWIVLEIYFDIHKDEELGWNTALGNSISVFWISSTLMGHMFVNNFQNFGWPKLIAIALLMSYSLFIAYISFTHNISSNIVFYLASPTPVCYFSGIVVLFAYDAMSFSKWIIIDIFLLFGMLLLFVHLFRKYGPLGRSGEYSGY